MKRIVLALAVCTMLAGCGGGDTTAPAEPPAVQKVSAVDGTWKYGFLQSDGTMYWIGQTTFSNGTAYNYASLGSLNTSKTGTFVVTDNTLTVTYTHSTVSPSGLSIPDLGNVHSIEYDINETSVYTFAVTPYTLALNNNAGVITVYSK